MDTIQDVADYMKRHELLLVTAESCTAGLIAATLADVPGAGALLDCAYVTYSPESKQACLGVSADTLERFNLTSEEVAAEMAQGAVHRSRANVAISNTGVADDGGDAPAGTQCFAWAFQNGDEVVTLTETRRFDGDRNSVREQSAQYALLRLPFHHGQLASRRPAVT